jgi:hypothetical protein
MDAHRSEMTDEALDRELRALFDVEPSPALAARVRAQLADSPPRRAWLAMLPRAPWLGMAPRTAVAAFAIAAAAVVALAVGRSIAPATRTAPAHILSASARAEGVGVQRVATQSAAGPHETEAPETDITATRQPSTTGGVAARAAHRASGLRNRPADVTARAVGANDKDASEVLIDPREAAALRALILGTREGRIALSPAAAASTVALMDLPPAVDIQIPAIVIDPIAPDTGEGVRQ